jgi:hypothetical protein
VSEKIMSQVKMWPFTVTVGRERHPNGEYFVRYENEHAGSPEVVKRFDIEGQAYKQAFSWMTIHSDPEPKAEDEDDD